MTKKAKLTAGAILGAAAGVVAGLLVAPKSGKETRNDIKHQAAALKDKAAKKSKKTKK